MNSTATQYQANLHAHPVPLESALEEADRERFGFLSPWEVASLAGNATGQLTPILLRFGCSRLVCGAQYVRDIVAALEASGDYLRDASLPLEMCDEVRRQGARHLVGLQKGGA